MDIAILHWIHVHNIQIYCISPNHSGTSTIELGLGAHCLRLKNRRANQYAKMHESYLKSTTNLKVDFSEFAGLNAARRQSPAGLITTN